MSPRALEWCAFGSLLLLAVFYLHLSWRRWPDIQIDFGRELYVPWRLAEGDVLGREVESPFGPFSQYFNAALFRLFGPSLMALVSANLVIYCAILATVHRLLRAGWDALGAWAGCVVFVTIFSFSQYSWVGNYNFAAPYAHEATHGFLVCLLLTSSLVAYLRRPCAKHAVVPGALFGLTALLKIEFIAAGAIVLAIALALHRTQHGLGLARRHAMLFGTAATMPSLMFFVFLAQFQTWRSALFTTGKAWLSFFAQNRFAGEPDQKHYLGTDHLWSNLTGGALAACVGLVIIGGLLLLARGIDSMRRSPRTFQRRNWIAVGGLIAVAAVVGACIPWVRAGRGLVWMVALAGCLALYQYRREPADREGATIRILVIGLSLALLLRMALNVRFNHYGFVQASLATAVMVAIILSDWPRRCLAGQFARNSLRFGFIVMLGVGVVLLSHISASQLARKATPVGSGSDMFHHYSRDLTPERETPPDDHLFSFSFLAPPSPLKPELIGALTAWRLEHRLARENDRARWFSEAVAYFARTKPDDTVLVVPEGVMLNYLSRRAAPLPVTKFFGVELANGGEARLVEGLRRKPPDYVVLLSRDLSDLGISRFGTKPGEGKLLLEWIAANFDSVARAGGMPFEPNDQGLVILRRKNLSRP